MEEAAKDTVEMIERRLGENVEETHSAQIGIIAQEQTEMKVAQSTLNEKCEEVSVKVDAIKQQVSNDKDQLTERQQRAVSYTHLCGVNNI